ncbi:translation initiation factor IF-5A [Candidatus Pacearchaeota archaeon CG10_big_fil_rev_8_21_14_0_10_34_76]|nr:MAG: translation initiation factor IF-5A [Candidatus Pacearchaeota archaeon CG10_big_fil_rev_8_21_14_0_10_34_76]
MVLKLIDATQARSGVNILIDGEAYTVKSNDISKSGKHGASKCRIEAVSLTGGKKKVLAVPGHLRFEVPMIDKRKGQILSVGDHNASVMDLESFETLDLPYPEEVAGDLVPEKQVEYWDIEGYKVIRRVL